MLQARHRNVVLVGPSDEDDDEDEESWEDAMEVRSVKERNEKDSASR